MTYGGCNIILQNLYKLGGRRFGVIGVAAIGCCPAVRVKIYGGECMESLNQFAIALNSATISLMNKLSYELKDLKYSFGNSFAMTSAVLQRPTLFGKCLLYLSILFINFFDRPTLFYRPIKY